MRKLAMLSGSLKGTVFALADECISLGRAEEGNIHLDDPSVSRHHAMLTLAGTEYRLRDLNSANGTAVNGHSIVETLLRPGDEIRFGDVYARYDYAPVGATIVARPALDGSHARAGRGLPTERPLQQAATVDRIPAGPAARSGADVGGPAAQPAPALAPVVQKLTHVPGPTPDPSHLRQGFGGQAGGGDRKRINRRFWTALVIVDLAVVVWAVAFVARKRWQEVVPAAPVVASAPATVAAPQRQVYRDPKGRFTCEIPAGWTIVEDHGDPRSKVRFVSGADEIRVIAQQVAPAGLEESDREAAVKTFGDMIERARAAGADGQLLTADWRTLPNTRGLQVEVEMRPPEYLWMRQLKFRMDTLDHTVAICVAAPAQREALAHVFEEFVASYTSLPQTPLPTVAAMGQTTP